MRKAKIETTQYLSVFNEYFPEAATKIAHDQSGSKYIEAQIPNVNLNLVNEEWRELPVHFYSDLPHRLEDMWSSMQKRKLETFVDYIKSIGEDWNPTLLLSKLSKNGNRYFIVTSKAKFLQYRDAHYTGYSVETI